MTMPDTPDRDALAALLREAEYCMIRAPHLLGTAEARSAVADFLLARGVRLPAEPETCRHGFPPGCRFCSEEADEDDEDDDGGLERTAGEHGRLPEQSGRESQESGRHPHLDQQMAQPTAPPAPAPSDGERERLAEWAQREGDSWVKYPVPPPVNEQAWDFVQYGANLRAIAALLRQPGPDDIETMRKLRKVLDIQATTRRMYETIRRAAQDVLAILPPNAPVGAQEMADRFAALQATVDDPRAAGQPGAPKEPSRDQIADAVALALYGGQFSAARRLLAREAAAQVERARPAPQEGT